MTTWEGRKGGTEKHLGTEIWPPCWSSRSNPNEKSSVREFWGDISRVVTGTICGAGKQKQLFQYFYENREYKKIKNN